jgi:hypothetical protein
LTPPDSEKINLPSGRLLLRHATAPHRRSTGRLCHRRLHTGALVEGLSGKAGLNKDGHVDTAQLNDYLQKRVPELAKPFQHEQNPQFFKGRDAEIYTLAVAHYRGAVIQHFQGT